MYGLRVGADMYESNKLTGAIDELYVYTSALDREAISVLYGSVTASPTVTPAPSTYYFEGTLRAYYSFDEGNATDATGAYSGDTYKNGHARNLGPTESRDGGDALGFDGEVYAVLPDALTYEALTGDEERTICLWARIDDWDGGFLFEYGSDSADGASLGLAVGDAESNVTLALSGSYQTVVTIYGNTSYIDWDDWHHYCLTYDGSDVVLYFDGLAEATAPASLDTETMYGLRVGADMYESNKLTGAIDELYVYTSALDREAISVLYGSVTASPTTVVTIYGNTSYIDWDDWHHYCLTYDGSDVTMYGLRVGADMYESNKLTGAIDELYVYTSALDREAISVLYGSVTASPTVTPAPSTYYFEGTLRAYYSFDEGNATDATGAYSGDTYKNGHARNLGPTESRDTVVTIYGNTSYIDWDDWHHYCLTYDGSDVVLYFDGLAEATPRRLSTRRPCTGFEWAPTCTKRARANLGPTESRDGGDALGFDGEVYAVLPDALTYEALTGDEERTICLWARIDDWDGGFLFEYGSDSADGASLGRRWRR
ncbi:hypothetical protein SO694_00030243 [Aureococcus anophagefferens]|uniref:LamG-like jellyroll fold domain-containing protein n=1 Tax=Aureococcus anophagefferens TaxID=44056 RepID=A0ABR1FJY7_AURAN